MSIFKLISEAINYSSILLLRKTTQKCFYLTHTMEIGFHQQRETACKVMVAGKTMTLYLYQRF